MSMSRRRSTRPGRWSRSPAYLGVAADVDDLDDELALRLVHDHLLELLLGLTERGRLLRAVGLLVSRTVARTAATHAKR